MAQECLGGIQATEQGHFRGVSGIIRDNKTKQKRVENLMQKDTFWIFFSHQNCWLLHFPP